MTTVLTDWQQRVVAEQAALKANVEKLAKYLAEHADTLQKHEKVLMSAQLNAMCTLSDVIQMRIDLFNQVVDPNEELSFPITSVGEFGSMISGWFEQVKHDLRHMMEVPDGTEINVGTSADPTEPVVSITLTGDTLQAFRTGILTAMGVVDTLPVSSVEIGHDQDGNIVAIDSAEINNSQVH